MNNQNHNIKKGLFAAVLQSMLDVSLSSDATGPVDFACNVPLPALAAADGSDPNVVIHGVIRKCNSSIAISLDIIINDPIDIWDWSTFSIVHPNYAYCIQRLVCLVSCLPDCVGHIATYTSPFEIRLYIFGG